jgi:hypothetical protein
VNTGEAALVVNVTSLPLTVPAEFLATNRKWYFVPGFSPRMRTETFLVFVPAFRLWTAVLDLYDFEVPYSK